MGICSGADKQLLLVSVRPSAVLHCTLYIIGVSLCLAQLLLSSSSFCISVDRGRDGGEEEGEAVKGPPAERAPKEAEEEEEND